MGSKGSRTEHGAVASPTAASVAWNRLATLSLRVDPTPAPGLRADPHQHVPSPRKTPVRRRRLRRTL